jgi:hypothetical protein
MVACTSPLVTMPKAHLDRFTQVYSIAFATGQWPRITLTLFLEQLVQQKWCQLNNEWKECIVLYGVALTGLHRAVRLRALQGRKMI